MLPVFIPSRGRAKLKLIQSGAYSQLPKGHHVAYVVPHDEHQSYASLGIPVIARPPEVQGVAAARHYIGWYCQQFDIPKFIMVDDDLKFFTRISEDDWHLRRSQPEDMAEMLASVESHLDVYGQVGISARTGANRVGSGPKPLLKEATRTNGCTAYRTADFMSVEHSRLPFMEDFDVTLQLLLKGVANCCFYHWSYDQSMTNAPGGCSLYRTHEGHEASARKLAELHPGFVSLRQKANKTGGEFGERTEVTVQWKKAHEAGQRRLKDGS